MTMTGAYEFTEVVRGRTEIRFSSLFRRGTEYAVEHVMGYSMYPSPYAPLYSHLRYDIFRDGEFIGQEAEYECALRLVAVDFAYRLWRGPLGVILRDEDRLEELVWWFVREIPEKRGNINIATVTNAYRPTKTPERKPDPPKRGSSFVAFSNMMPVEMAKRGFISWGDALQIAEEMKSICIANTVDANEAAKIVSEVASASVVTQKRIT